jgi:hypothetical protein
LRIIGVILNQYGSSSSLSLHPKDLSHPTVCDVSGL